MTITWFAPAFVQPALLSDSVTPRARLDVFYIPGPSHFKATFMGRIHTPLVNASTEELADHIGDMISTEILTPVR